eukprot:352001-Chlamydomonas_euryale.AAC.7
MGGMNAGVCARQRGIAPVGCQAHLRGRCVERRAAACAADPPAASRAAAAVERQQCDAQRRHVFLAHVWRNAQQARRCGVQPAEAAAAARHCLWRGAGAAASLWHASLGRCGAVIAAAAVGCRPHTPTALWVAAVAACAFAGRRRRRSSVQHALKLGGHHERHAWDIAACRRCCHDRRHHAARLLRKMCSDGGLRGKSTAWGGGSDCQEG